MSSSLSNLFALFHSCTHTILLSFVFCFFSRAEDRVRGRIAQGRRSEGKWLIAQGRQSEGKF